MTLTSAARPILDGLEPVTLWLLGVPPRPSTIGDVIRTWRESLGWSQRRLGRLIGVSSPVPGCWERNEMAPSPGHEAALRLLGCPLPVIERVKYRRTGAGRPRGYWWRGKWRPW